MALTIQRRMIREGIALRQGIVHFNATKHYRCDRIASNLSICYIAYLLWITIREMLREEKFNLSPDMMMGILKLKEMVRFTSSGEGKL